MGGGKSRKSGGVSRKLIERIKRGDYSTQNEKSTKRTKKKEPSKSGGGFGLLPGTTPESGD